MIKFIAGAACASVIWGAYLLVRKRLRRKRYLENATIVIGYENESANLKFPEWRSDIRVQPNAKNRKDI